MKRARRFLIAGTAVVAVVAVGGAFVYRFSGIADRNALTLELARARRLGLPSAPEEVWGPPVPGVRNAAPLYAQLIKHERVLNRVAGDLKRIPMPRTPAEVSAYEETLASAHEGIALFERATAKPDCRFVWSVDWDAIYPELSAIRAAGQALAARARLEAAMGHPLKAFATLTEIARARRHLDREPFLIVRFTGQNIEEDLLRNAQSILADCPRRPDVRDAARGMIAALGPVPSEKDALRGQWLFHRSFLADAERGKIRGDMFVSDDGSVPPEQREMNFILSTPSLKARQELVMTHLFLDEYAAMPDDPTDVSGTRTAVGDLQTRLNSGGFDATLAKHLIEPFGRGGEISGKALAGRRTFLALLKALEPPIPPRHLPVKGRDGTDPFTNLPLHYVATPGEIKVWSVGPDGKDDGGLVRRKTTGEDVTAVWTLRR